MKIALFSDATSHPLKQKTGIAALCFNVTQPDHPILLFQEARAISFCNAGEAEDRAAELGVREIIRRNVAGQFEAASITLFTDSDSVKQGYERRRSLLPEFVHELGRPFSIEVIPRKLNRRADHLAHTAIKPMPTFTPIEKDRTVELIRQYPFLDTLNA